MDPNYGIVSWIVIGGLAGWIGGKLVGTDARPGTLANIGIGITGAVLGGFLSRFFFGTEVGTNGLLGSFLIALAGSCFVILGLKAVTRVPA